MREFKNNTQRTKSPVGYIEKDKKRSSGLTNLGETKASPWGRLAGLLVFMFLAVITNAQPLPPTTPDGNPVPVESFSLLLLAVGGLLVYLRKKKDEGIV